MPTNPDEPPSLRPWNKYEIFPPKLDSPRIISPTDPYLKSPDPNTTRRPWSNPSRTPVYGDPSSVKGPTRDPEPRDKGPNEANDFRPPIIVPGERWKSSDK